MPTLLAYGARSGAVALALLLAAAPFAYADNGTRHGGRRAPPPTPPANQPAWVGQPAARPAASAPRAATASDHALSARRPHGSLGSPQVGHGPSVPRYSAPSVPSVARHIEPAPRTFTRGAGLADTRPSGTHHSGVRAGSPALASQHSPLALRPHAGTAASSRRDSVSTSGLLAPGSRPGLPSTWISARERLRSDAATASRAGVRHGAPASAHHAPAHGATPTFGSLPTHRGGVYYGGRRSYEPSPVFAPTWGYHRPYVPSFTFVSVWGYGCYCEPPATYVEPLYAPPLYVEPVYPQPLAPAYGPSPAPYYEAPAAPPAYAQAPQPEPQPEPQPQPATPSDPQAPRAPSAEQQQILGRSLEAFRAGRTAEALALLDGAVQADPTLGDAWLGIAYAGFALERHERAAQALTQAAQLGAFPRGYRFDARALFPSAAAYDAALARLVARVAMAPRDADARLVLAWLQVSAGERAAAQEQILQVLTLRPADEAAPILALALLPAAPAAAGQQR